MNPFRTVSRRVAAAAAGAALLGACSDTTVPDLNNPSQASYEKISDRGQLQALATGLVAGDRAAYNGQLTFSEIMARDLIRFDPAESRYLTRLLGTSLSNSDFIGSGVWNGPYGTIRGANLLIKAVDAADAVTPTPLSAAEKAATRGYAQTIKALQYARVIELRDINGAPIATNPDSAVALRCKPAVLSYISAVYDSAATDLRTAGAVALPFSLPSGFAGFTTADAASGTDFLAFNRGLKARIEMYRGFLPLQTANDVNANPDQAALTAALAAIDASFYNATPTRAALDVGVYHTYSTASGETPNPLVDVGVFRVNTKVITEGAEPGDQRIQVKVDTASTNANRTNGSGASLIASRYLVRFPASPSDRLGMLKNGELVLNRALVLWGLRRDAEAIQMLNIVRQAAGLPARTAANFATRKDLVLAILKEKRYELLFESPARYIDFRMLGLTADLGRERGNNVIPRFPIPNNEVVARSGNITCVN